MAHMDQYVPFPYKAVRIVLLAQVKYLEQNIIGKHINCRYRSMFVTIRFSGSTAEVRTFDYHGTSIGSNYGEVCPQDSVEILVNAKCSWK